MNSLKIKNFKAYQEELDELVLPNSSNLLLYGENGSGKSSIYEAIKVVFFKNKLVQGIPVASTPEEQPNINNNFWAKYKNNSATSAFEIEVNNENYAEFNSNPYQVFMIAMDRLCVSGSLRLDELLQNFDLEIEAINEFCHEYYEAIETKVNSKLKEFQEKNISIVIDNEDDFSIKIIDSNRGLSYKENIKNYFNEAKLNLIILLLLFEAIKCAKKSDKKKILVLDDFITSLDMSNRTFLMKYILETFGDDFQIIILTHNVYFYNLIRYLVNESSQAWKMGNLYEASNQHKFYMNPSKKQKLKLDKLEEKISNLTEETIATIGNEFRQKFEILLYELSKILMIGGVEESKNILETIRNQDKLYFYKEGNTLKGSIELLGEIEKVIESGTPHIDTIKTVIEKYSINNLDEIKRILRDLKLYQKVHMHHLSHGHIGDSNFSIKEAKETLLLLKKLETNIFSLMNHEMAGT